MSVCISVDGHDRASMECLETIDKEDSQESASWRYNRSARNSAFV